MCLQRFNNKVALITGASSGIGAAIARRLSEEGAKVSLFARRENFLKKAIEEIREKGSDGFYHAGDVTNERAVKNCVARTVEYFGKIDILLNGAGIGIMLPLAVTSEEKWKYAMDVNLGGAIRFIQSVQPIMTRSKGGVIINISSVFGLIGARGLSIYSMTKGGIVALTKAVALELAPRGIRVNAIAPGIVETELTSRMLEKLTGEQIEQIRQMHPLGFGSVEDVASAVAYVASDEARWMTGTILTIDGGYSAK